MAESPRAWWGPGWARDDGPKGETPHPFHFPCSIFGQTIHIQGNHPMWQFDATPSRKQMLPKSISARRCRLYRPHCTPLEDRCLLSVSLSASNQPFPWSDRRSSGRRRPPATGQHPSTRFSVEPAGGTFQVVQRLQPQQQLHLEPHAAGDLRHPGDRQGRIQRRNGESATATYTAQTRVVGNTAPWSAPWPTPWSPCTVRLPPPATRCTSSSPAGPHACPGRIPPRCPSSPARAPTSSWPACCPTRPISCGTSWMMGRSPPRWRSPPGACRPT